MPLRVELIAGERRGGDFVSRSAPLEIRFDRPLSADERVAVFVGNADLTALFEPVPGGIRYAPRILSHASGEGEVVVYLVRRQGSWEEIGRFPLRVRSPLGFDSGRFDPAIDLGMEGPLAEGRAPEDETSRGAYQDVRGSFGLETGFARGDFSSINKASVIGVSRRQNALRFGELRNEAPLIDLSDYQARFAVGGSSLTVGHVALGNHRHLINGLSTRGTSFDLELGSRLDVSGGIANGSRIVGWANPLGLADPDHRIVSGRVGIEALGYEGGLRLDVSGMSGSVLPRAGYNQGTVNDAEESDGFAVRLQASDPGRRLRLEGGFSRSRFDNPDDPSLARGAELVDVGRVTRDARYVDVDLDVLRGLQIGGGRSAGLAIGYRHERVDPLYRSVGAFARADVLSNEWSARATIGAIALQASHGRSRDNLDRVASVLTSHTRRTGASAVVPLPNLVARDAKWLPTLSYGFDRTHQFGEGIPENGEFSESHVPDQVSRNQSFGADWELGPVALGYRLDHSHQDNRQPGREDADLTNLVNGVLLGVRPVPALSLDVSVDVERAENEERDEVDRTRRYGLRASWRPFSRSTLAFSISHTRSEDEAETREREDRIIDARWSSVIPGLSRLGAQYYVRFSRNVSDVTDRAFDRGHRASRWSLNSGLSLRLF